VYTLDLSDIISDHSSRRVCKCWLTTYLKFAIFWNVKTSGVSVPTFHRVVRLLIIEVAGTSELYHKPIVSLSFL
jgi:hypothetical protein